MRIKRSSSTVKKCTNRDWHGHCHCHWLVLIFFIWEDRAPMKKKLPLRAFPTLSLMLRRRCGEIFLCDSNTKAFCAEGAEKIFHVIATHKPFAPKARREFFTKT